MARTAVRPLHSRVVLSSACDDVGTARQRISPTAGSEKRRNCSVKVSRGHGSHVATASIGR